MVTVDVHDDPVISRHNKLGRQTSSIGPMSAQVWNGHCCHLTLLTSVDKFISYVAIFPQFQRSKTTTSFFASGKIYDINLLRATPSNVVTFFFSGKINKRSTSTISHAREIDVLTWRFYNPVNTGWYWFQVSPVITPYCLGCESKSKRQSIELFVDKCLMKETMSVTVKVFSHCKRRCVLMVRNVH